MKQLYIQKTLAPFIGWSAIYGMILFSGCDQGTERNERFKGDNSANVAKSGPGEYKLSWSPPKGKVTRFHVFYTLNLQTNKGGKEIDSFATNPQLLKAPFALLNRTNIDPFPTGPTAMCFYVVHANGNVRSAPSDSVCVPFDGS